MPRICTSLLSGARHDLLSVGMSDSYSRDRARVFLVGVVPLKCQGHWNRWSLEQAAELFSGRSGAQLHASVRKLDPTPDCLEVLCSVKKGKPELRKKVLKGVQGSSFCKQSRQSMSLGSLPDPMPAREFRGRHPSEEGLETS